MAALTGCIWCQGSTTEGGPDEHIVPEVLGCPPGFLLPSTVVCEQCNNGLGHLDQAVADDLDFVAFLAGVPRKKGKSPAITNRGNVTGFIKDGRPEIHFNMDGTAMRIPSGGMVAGYKGSPRNVKANWRERGKRVRISFDHTIGKSKKFQRGIYKIALSTLAYFIGAAELYKPKYDSLRQYVRKGIGTRHLILATGPDPDVYRHDFWRPHPQPGDYALVFRLACVLFVVDLSESERRLAHLKRVAQQSLGQGQWIVLPTQ